MSAINDLFVYPEGMNPQVASMVYPSSSFTGAITNNQPNLFAPSSSNNLPFQSGVAGDITKLMGLVPANQRDTIMSQINSMSDPTSKSSFISSLLNMYGGAQNLSGSGGIGQWSVLGSNITSNPQQLMQSTYNALFPTGATTTPAAGGASNNNNLQQLLQLLASSGGSNQAAAANPLQSLLSSSPSGSTGVSSSIDQWLASQAGNTSYLTNLINAGGNPVNVTPAWEAMVAAQKQNVDRGAADLAEYFGRGGAYFSTSFGDALQQYYNQATADQNSTLGQLQLAASENAAGRVSNAAQILAQLGYGGASQLSSQGFTAGQNDLNRQLQALMYMAQGSDTAASSLASASNTGAQQLLQNAVLGATGLYGTENTAATNMYSSLMNLIPSYLNYDTTTTGQNLGAANMLSSLLNQNLITGNTLGQTQYSTMNQALSSAYNEWLRTQPEYSALLPYLMQVATGQQTMYYPQYTQSNLASTMGASGQMLALLMKLFGLGG